MSATTKDLNANSRPADPKATLAQRIGAMIDQRPWISAGFLGLILALITAGTIASAQSRPRPNGVTTNGAIAPRVESDHASAQQPVPTANPSAPLRASAAVQQAPEGVVNINTASEEELQRLPGIGPARATAIVALRARVQRFRATDDLLRIRGIGRVSFRRLRPYLTLTAETTLLARPGRVRNAQTSASPQ
jgi:competence protein ComEA